MAVSVHDVAAYFLAQRSPMSTMKLQKLCYYAQAWHLVWDETPLFPEQIEAWANGPVVYELYLEHRGLYEVSGPLPKGDANRLSASERETIDAVLDGYGALSGRQLGHLTHHERPWLEARGDLDPTERSTTPISLDVMQEFYAALDSGDAQPVQEIDWGQPGTSS